MTEIELLVTVGKVVNMNNSGIIVPHYILSEFAFLFESGILKTDQYSNNSFEYTDIGRRIVRHAGDSEYVEYIKNIKDDIEYNTDCFILALKYVYGKKNTEKTWEKMLRNVAAELPPFN